MKQFSEILKKHNFIPLLRLLAKEEGRAPQSTGEHVVRILEAKEGKKANRKTGQIMDAVWILVEEKGEKYKYPIAPIKDSEGQLHYLLQRLAEIPDGEEVILEGMNKGGKSYIDVRRIGETKAEEIPIIEENDERHKEDFGEEESL